MVGEPMYLTWGLSKAPWNGSCGVYLEGHGDLVSRLMMGIIGAFYMAYKGLLTTY